MADNEPQQALLLNGDFTLANNISESQLPSDFQNKNNEVISTSDILQRAFDEAGGFDQTLLPRHSDHSSTVQDNIQHLTDHSYIHIKSNTDTSTVSQNAIPNCNDSNNEIDLPNLQFSSNADLNSSHELETNFTNQASKLNLPIDGSDKLSLVNDILTKQILATSTDATSVDSMCSNNLVIQSEKVTPLPFILKKKAASLSSNAPSSSPDSVISLRLPMNMGNSSIGSLNNELPTKSSNSSLGSLSGNESIASTDSVFPKDSNANVQIPTTKTLQFALKQSIQSLSTNSSSSSNSTVPIKLSAKPTAPLGSVANPIQIIHNGTSYHSTQTLTPEQLQQITHVLQQQHAKKLANGGKSSILFEPNTRTRIVCRVVHPSELQPKTSKPEISRISSSPMAGKGRGRPKSKDRSFEDDEKNYSKEEREERKKHRPRTRSGRISKPPNHLAKDYKRIHPLDLNEEVYDDSDGGYSDYHVSDDESNKKESKTTSLPPGVTTAKPRNYSCAVCDKAYIGRGGLSRHYRLNPSHGSLPEGEDTSTQDENSNSSMASSILSNSGSNTNNQSIPVTPTPSIKPSTSVLQEDLRQDSIPNVQQIPQPSVNQIDPIMEKRKTRLKEILKGYTTSEIVDALLPKFTEEISTWKFFTTKCHRETEGETLFEMLKEFEKFLTPMQRVSCSCLSRATEADRGKTIINITSQRLAEALTLEKGSYTVNGSEMVETNLNLVDYRLSNVPSSNADSEATNQPLHDFQKRKRLDPSVVDVNAGLPEQILSDAQESSCLDLPMTVDEFSENSNLHHQQTNLLNVCVAQEATQNDLTHKNIFDLNSSTIVTPSSLSSGCLSAVNSSNLQKRSLFSSPSNIQNMQVKKIRLLNAALQNQTAHSMNLNGLALSPNGILTGLTSQTQAKDGITVQAQDDMVSSSSAIENKTFHTISLESAAGIFNSCSELSQTNLLDAHQSSSNVDPSTSFVNSFHINNNCLTADSHKVSAQSDVTENLANCLVVAGIPHSLENPNTSISESDIQTCVPAGIIPISSHPEERQFQVTSTDIVSSDNVKAPEQAVLRQLMLPDGRLIGVWSPVENTDKASNEQILQGFLPSNLILVQNTDGSFQVPQNQGSALETLQALTSADSASSEQARSLAHPSVNM